MNKRTLLAALWLVLAPLVWADVDYHIDINDPAHHSAKVTISFQHQGAVPLEVKLPNWRTGRYTILPLADGIRDFAATTVTGDPLSWRKTARGTWQIEGAVSGEVIVSYTVVATELGQRSRHIDDTHAYLNASGVFMYNPKQRDETATIALTVPTGWNSVSGMTRLGEHQFQAANYDVLVDSPIETGIHSSYGFEVDDRQYQLVIWGGGNYDAEQMVDDLKALAATSGRFYNGDYPYDNYLFIVHATTGVRGATEHLNSTVIQRPRWQFAKRKEYLSFIATAAHELVHTWNVKAYRPQGLTPYDYQHENYTDLLWFAEGGTSYLQTLWLLRAGVMTTEEYLADLASRIQTHQVRPGNQKQTVAESSFDNWIARGGDYGLNNSVSIYSEGFLANWSLDLWLQQHDQQIEALHRALYQQHRLPQGYSSSKVQTLLNQLARADSQPWWQATVESPLQLSFDTMLQQVGLRLVYPEKQQLDLGVTLIENNKLKTVSRGGPAWQAGLTANDQLVAFNGLQFDGANWQTQWQRLPLEQSLTVAYFRDERLLTTTLTPQRTFDGKLKLEAVADATELQRQNFSAWTGVDWAF